MTADAQTRPGFGHFAALDLVRATAILIVMAAHTGLQRVLPGGFGVTLFFFLSGYLITSLLRAEAQRGPISLRAFYLRRTVRIMPPMFITIVAALVLTAAKIATAKDGFAILTDFAFLSNYARTFGLSSPVQIPLWSLDVEEHFYLIFPAIYIAVISKMPARSAALCCFALCLVVLAVRFYCAAYPDRLEDIYYWSHTRIDSILFGCALAVWKNPAYDPDAVPLNRRWLAVCLVLFVASFALHGEYWRQTIRYSLQGLALFLLFSWLIRHDRYVAPVATLLPVRMIATWSYTLYLVHLPMLYFFDVRGFAVPWLWGYGAAMLYAAAMARLVERPLARWRRRIEAQMAALAASD